MIFINGCPYQHVPRCLAYHITSRGPSSTLFTSKALRQCPIHPHQSQQSRKPRLGSVIFGNSLQICLQLPRKGKLPARSLTSSPRFRYCLYNPLTRLVPLQAKLIQPVVKNTHLDRPTLSLCVSLIENGIDPEVLAVSRGSSGLAEKALTPNPSRRSSRS